MRKGGFFMEGFPPAPGEDIFSAPAASESSFVRTAGVQHTGKRCYNRRGSAGQVNGEKQSHNQAEGGTKMGLIKIMPCLDMKEGRVVKGVNFINLKDAGDPVENASFYQEEGADELAMLDIAATVENRKTRLEWVKSVSSVTGIPLTVGGGISSIEDIGLVLEAGAQKVSMNSAAVMNPELVRQAAEQFGPAKITIAIDGKRNPGMPSGFELVVSGGTKPVGKDAVQWARACQELGAGAILPTSMDGDGTQAGYDLEFTRAISEAVDLPVVASGGAGTLEHFYDGASKGGANILLAASVFHYRILSIREVKEYLRWKGLEVDL
jgi:cyclase